MKLNILIAGVGGQGTLLASRVLGNYAGLMGYDCKMNEVHGMAQRGGSVVCYVKFADKVYSPTVADGDADILFAFEELEALRNAYAVKAGGKMLVNVQQIMPLPVITGAVSYPSDIISELKKYPAELFTADAKRIADQLGNPKVVNTVMLGLLARIVNFDREMFQRALMMSVPEKASEINRTAFEKGYEG